MKEVYSALSKREKQLLYILLVFLLVMAGWFFAIKPSLENYRKQKNLLSQKETTLAELKSQLTQYQNAPSQLAAQTQTYKSLTKKYYKVLKNEKISEMFTDEIKSANLTPTNLTISDAQDDVSSSNNTSNSSSSSSSATSTDTQAASSTNAKLVTKYVDVTVNGKIDQVSDLLQNIEGDTKSVGVTGLSYTPASTSSDTKSEDSFTIQFAVYMIKK
ncbi:type II secretion system protein GspM [Intestinibaculum porci]|uniref:type II secretion system protein GspM n=1 Tax=Intestinibaculum porci TaxID=2487118 RepID=UPI0024098D89|nr:type II secretion system protein GspM [Intestinibaculum porci]MDD6348420.1 type II secretion system protein GspM [Intestinibaculum porci]